VLLFEATFACVPKMSNFLYWPEANGQWSILQGQSDEYYKVWSSNTSIFLWPDTTSWGGSYWVIGLKRAQPPFWLRRKGDELYEPCPGCYWQFHDSRWSNDTKWHRNLAAKVECVDTTTGSPVNGSGVFWNNMTLNATDTVSQTTDSVNGTNIVPRFDDVSSESNITADNGWSAWTVELSPKDLVIGALVVLNVVLIAIMCSVCTPSRTDRKHQKYQAVQVRGDSDLEELQP